MKIPFLPLFLFFLIIISGFTPAARGQNLITNPYFIQGFTGWTGTYGIYNRALNPSPQFGGVAGIVDAGQNAMSQSFLTTIGVTYQVTWDVRLPDLGPSGHPVEGEQTVGPAQLTVGLNGLFMSESIQNRTVWQPFSAEFTATGTSTGLSFQVPAFLSNGSRSEDVFMDYVTAVPVPEPSSAIILLLALPLFFVHHRLRFVWLNRS